MQEAASTQPGPDAGVDLSAEAAGRFLAAAGLVVDAAGGTRVAGHIDLGPDHHTPWGVVHGGVYTTAVETAASLGASLAVRDRGQFAVGVHNATDFLRPATSGRAEVIAEPCSRAVSSNCGLSPSPTSAAGRSHAARSGCRTFRSPAPAQADERPRRAAAHPAPSRSQFRRLRARFRSLRASSRSNGGKRTSAGPFPLSCEPSRSGGLPPTTSRSQAPAG